jgi:hypothetical protein
MAKPKKISPPKQEKKKSKGSALKDMVKQTIQPPPRAITPPEKNKRNKKKS